MAGYKLILYKMIQTVLSTAILVSAMTLTNGREICPKGEVYSFLEKACIPSEDYEIPPATDQSICPPSGIYFLPYPTDCTKFIFCLLGNATIMDCPFEQHFSKTNLTCMPPDIAECIPETTIDPPTETTEAPTETTEAPTETTEAPSETTESPITIETPPSTINPEMCASGYPVAHPTDCTKYYDCSTGVPILQTCSDGLYFSPTEMTCTIPKLSGCTAASFGNSLHFNLNYLYSVTLMFLLIR